MLKLRRAPLIALCAALLAACAPAQPAPVEPTVAPAAPTDAPAEPPAATPQADGGPVLLTGTLRFTADYILDLYVEHAVALTDMHGFVMRDQLWELPLEGQALGPISFDRAAGAGTYRLALPARPSGTPSDVDNDGVDDPGVQIFNLAWSPNLADGVFSEGDDRSFGWASGFASTTHDPDNEDEVTGGRLVVWAPDAQQQFPTGFGADRLLFTADDPVGPLPAGYSVVDLDQAPFALLREPEQALDLYEPQNIEAIDLSDLPYDEALRRTVEEARGTYAFVGIPGKEPAWDELLAELEPRAREAEARGDSDAFYQVMLDFTYAFRDGHVGLGGNTQGASARLREATQGGYGFAVRELDDGRFLVVYVLPDGPAASAGIQVGAELTAFNGEPVAQAAARVRPLGGPFSSDIAERYQQARYLLRAPIGNEASVTFVNPDGQPQTATLRAVEERESFSVTSIFRGAQQRLLPLEFEILPSGVGYIAIDTYFDDLSFMLKLYERALATFEAAQVPGIIVDLRWNSGGIGLGLAGYLTDEEIPQGQGEELDATTGEFEPVGPRDRVRPNERQYRFDKVAVLVGLACASACEEEAYAFSRLPGATVVGQYPSSGVFASVVPEQYRLPDGLTLQLSMRRYTNPDGSLFLEGTGVVPTLKVPVDEETVFAEGDVELEAAEAAILGR